MKYIAALIFDIEAKSVEEVQQLVRSYAQNGIRQDCAIEIRELVKTEEAPDTPMEYQNLIDSLNNDSEKH